MQAISLIVRPAQLPLAASALPQQPFLPSSGALRMSLGQELLDRGTQAAALLPGGFHPAAQGFDSALEVAIERYGGPAPAEGRISLGAGPWLRGEQAHACWPRDRGQQRVQPEGPG